MRDFHDFIGKILTVVEVNRETDNIDFITDDGETYSMWHEQDCCEAVHIDDINGEIQDLIGVPILVASERSNSGKDGEYGESYTWTFYHFATIKGTVCFRWLGSSNGYYSESVSFRKTDIDVD